MTPGYEKTARERRGRFCARRHDRRAMPVTPSSKITIVGFASSWRFPTNCAEYVSNCLSKAFVIPCICALDHMLLEQHGSGNIKIDCAAWRRFAASTPRA